MRCSRFFNCKRITFRGRDRILWTMLRTASVSDQPKHGTLHRPRVKRRRLGLEYIPGVGAKHRLRVRKKSLDLLPWWLAFGLGDKELPQQRGARSVEQTAQQTE